MSSFSFFCCTSQLRQSLAYQLSVLQKKLSRIFFSDTSRQSSRNPSDYSRDFFSKKFQDLLQASFQKFLYRFPNSFISASTMFYGMIRNLSRICSRKFNAAASNNFEKTNSESFHRHFQFQDLHQRLFYRFFHRFLQ